MGILRLRMRGWFKFDMRAEVPPFSYAKQPKYPNVRCIERYIIDINTYHIDMYI